MTTFAATAPNRRVLVDGIAFAYRDLGPRDGVPVVMLNHWGATLDNFDPKIVDGLASKHRVIALNYRGLGLSEGSVRDSVSDMADDMCAVIHELGLAQVDLLGFSLGGFVAQEITVRHPRLVRKLVLTRTGPAGGEGVGTWGSMPWLFLKSLLTLRDPKYYLFFPPSPNGRSAAEDFLSRIAERKVERDASPSALAFYRQTLAAKAWGKRTPQNLGTIEIPVLIVNGDNDVMVPTDGSRDIAARIPKSQLILFEDSGHGAIFQYHEAFVVKCLAFLETS
ncbi:alpha/beta hydrolase fold [Pseudozyma hubeiensis SY62]|uniref:Alpha/beta hydrolase fold n=1 Tax=Pseudozyma hubeiensis (strain SY62) TaxID=1305764 RepID=R9P407_PSEHS|nr:alpha/beta hydrolase fold [Pseudozyma hubeiensis SY62]GAC96096.1 alpha/beta hydrolase fold [Pseudozyma hubeiensis SY62]